MTRQARAELAKALKTPVSNIDFLLEAQALNQVASLTPVHLVLDIAVVKEVRYGLWFQSGEAVDTHGGDAVKSIHFLYPERSVLKSFCMTLLHAVLQTFQSTGQRYFILHFSHKHVLWQVLNDGQLYDHFKSNGQWKAVHEECYSVLQAFSRHYDLSFKVADMSGFAYPVGEWDDMVFSSSTGISSYRDGFLVYHQRIPEVWFRRPIIFRSEVAKLLRPKNIPFDITELVTTLQSCVKQNTSTLQWIPQRFRKKFAEEWFKLMGEVLDHSNDPETWKKFLFFPLLILHNRNKANGSVLNHRLALWQECQFEDLFAELVGERERLVEEGSPCQVNTKLASKYCRIGNYSKSNRILQSSGLAANNQETFDQLQALHPEGPPLCVVERREPLASFITEDDYTRALWNCRNGLSIGPDGSHVEYFKSCHYLVTGFPRRVTSILNLLIGNSVPNQIRPLLSCSKLIALNKGGGRVRPIGIGNVLRKLAAKCLGTKHLDSFKGYLGAQQCGVATPSGIEKILAGVRHHWNGGKDTIISVDCSNAFNTVSRLAIYDQLQRHFPGLVPFFSLFYKEKGLLFTSSGDTLLSSAGVTQGCPLSPAFFALAIQPSLEMARAQFPNCIIYAYLDDIIIIGPSSDAGRCYAYLSILLRGIGLEVNPSKSKVFSSILHLGTEYQELTRVLHGLVILGVPWGSDAFVTSHLEELLVKCEGELKRLDYLPSLQERWLLFSHCFSNKIIFWLRTVDPSHTESFSNRYDALLLNHFKTWLGVSTVGMQAMSQLSLPIAKGGLGFAFMSRIFKAAFLAGTASGLSSLEINAGYLESSSWLESFRTIFQLFTSVEALEPMTEMMDLLDNPQLQTSLSEFLHDQHLTSLRGSLDDENRIRLDSIISSGSYWLRGRPGIVHFLLDNSTMVFSWKWRLGMPQFSSQIMGKRCHKCSSALDPFGRHIQRCTPYQKYRSVRHTDVKDMWIYVFKLAGLRCRKEPQGLYPPPQPGQRARTPDHLVPFFDLATGKSLLTDVSVVWPITPNTLSQREEKKKAYYGPELPRDASFVPLVCDVYGRWGSAVGSILNQCADHCYQNHQSFFDLKGSFQYYARTVLDVLLQKSLYGMFSAFLSHQVQSRDNTGSVTVVPHDFMGAGLSHPSVFAY